VVPMKKKFIIPILLVFTLIIQPAGKALAKKYRDFGDHTSSTLVVKAWGALENGDLEGVLAYTNRCIELYWEMAQKMQGILLEYPTGTDDQIHSFWALNDVATAYFIQGEAYRTAREFEKAKEAYQMIIDRYSFGQCWDLRGWFWKPAESAQEIIVKLEKTLEE